MTILEWSGEIGWDLWERPLKAQLKATKGDDITVRFSSIGGNIFDGSEIYNMLADHKRDNPNIKMNLEIKGVAASMASAIAASPAWDNISVEETTSFMIHNPRSFGFGDFKIMKQQAQFLEGARDMWAKVYAKKSGDSLSEIQDFMDAETWFFGQEIIDAGFADKINETQDNSDAVFILDKAVAIAQMKAKFNEMRKRQSELSEDEEFDGARAVACFRGEIPIKPDTSGDQPEISGAFKTVLSVIQKAEIPQDQKTIVESVLLETLDKSNKTVDSKDISSDSNDGEGNHMDKAELQKENPGVFKEILDTGTMAERDRVKILMGLKTQKEYKDIPEVCAAIDESIVEGRTPEETNTAMMAVMLAISNDPDRIETAEGAGDIQGGNQQSAGVQSKKIREV